MSNGTSSRDFRVILSHSVLRVAARCDYYHVTVQSIWLERSYREPSLLERVIDGAIFPASGIAFNRERLPVREHFSLIIVKNKINFVFLGNW